MVILPPDLYSTQEGPSPGWLGDMSHTPWRLFGTPTVQGGYPLVPLNLVSPMPGELLSWSPLPLDKSVQTLKSKIQQTISHPSEPLEKQSFSSAGSKGHICRLSLVDFDEFFLTIGKIFEKRNIQTTIMVVIFCFLFPNYHQKLCVWGLPI